MMTLDEIVKERFLSEKPDDPATCPYCGSSDVEVLSKSSTLVGYSGPVNPNHLWHASVCKGCGEHYTREIKGHNVWYTGERALGELGGIVLRGRPSCFEPYQYTCIKCGGPVGRTHKDLQGNPPKSLSSQRVNGVWTRNYTTHYHCTQCGHGGEVDEA